MTIRTYIDKGNRLILEGRKRRKRRRRKRTTKTKQKGKGLGELITSGIDSGLKKLLNLRRQHIKNMITGPYARKRKTVYFGSKTKPVSRSYMSKSGRLILGSGKRKKRGRKMKGKQRGG